MDLKKFFDTIRKDVNLTTQNVQGLSTVLEYLERTEDNLQQAAYILATAWWETAQTVMPVREAYWLSEDWRRRNLRYYPYYGRGYVQLTWDYNYKKASDYFKVDFVNNPDWVMNIEHALPILVIGMNEGWFTGKELDDYVDNIDESDDLDYAEYKNARRIVNGTDKAAEIARLAIIFEKGLKAAGYKYLSMVPDIPLKDTQKPVENDKNTSSTLASQTSKTSPEASQGFLEALIDFFKKLFSQKGN